MKLFSIIGVLLFSVSILFLTGCPKQQEPSSAKPAPVVPATPEKVTTPEKTATPEKESKPTVPALPEQVTPEKKTEVIEISSESQFLKILEENALVVVDFNATWCGPCRRLAPVLDEFSIKYKDKGIKFLSIDTDRNRRIAQAYNISGIPDLRFFVKKKVVANVVGARIDQIQANINALIEVGEKAAEDAKAAKPAAAPVKEESKEAKPVAAPVKEVSKEVKPVAAPVKEESKDVKPGTPEKK